MGDVTKLHFKVDGLNHIQRLEADKVSSLQDDVDRKIELMKEKEALKRTLHGVLDPEHMIIDLPTAPDTGSVSFDPEDMTFNI